MSTKTLYKNGTKVQVSYKTDHRTQTYRITEVVSGGESWDRQMIYSHQKKIVDAIHYGFSDIS